MEIENNPGARFARALAAKDFGRLIGLFDRAVDFADRERVGYRFRVHNPEGTFLIEQQKRPLCEEG